MDNLLEKKDYKLINIKKKIDIKKKKFNFIDTMPYNKKGEPYC